MYLKIPIHKDQKIGKMQKMLLELLECLFFPLFLLIFCIVKKIVPSAGIVALYAGLTMFICAAAYSKNYGCYCLLTDEQILCRNYPFYSKKICSFYSDLSLVYVDVCPVEYRIKTPKHTPSAEAWTRRYGDYITGVDQSGNCCFTCGYSQTMMEILTQKCPATTQFMKKEEYPKYLDEKKKENESLARQTEQEKETYRLYESDPNDGN